MILLSKRGLLLFLCFAAVIAIGATLIYLIFFKLP